MPVQDETLWNDYVEKNKDPYGGCCINVARHVMKILDEDQRPIEADDNKPFSAYKIINQADKDAGAGGITGFMAGAVAHMVSQCHSRGAEFRKAWNKSNGAEDAKGTVNPAIITVGKT